MQIQRRKIITVCAAFVLPNALTIFLIFLEAWGLWPGKFLAGEVPVLGGPWVWYISIALGVAFLLRLPFSPVKRIILCVIYIPVMLLTMPVFIFLMMLAGLIPADL
jgi:hypothetical protein